VICLDQLSRARYRGQYSSNYRSTLYSLPLARLKSKLNKVCSSVPSSILSFFDLIDPHMAQPLLNLRTASDLVRPLN